MKNMTLFLLFLIPGIFWAQEETNSSAQANNPLANMTALNLHNYYTPKLTNAPKDSYVNNTWLRFAKPLVKGKFLLRVSAPVNTVSTLDPLTNKGVSKNGLGDVNAFLSYSFISKPTATVGIGPLVVAPTASDDALGAGKWQGGLAFVAFIAKNPLFQYGCLVTWQTDMGGDANRPGTNFGAFQPFYFWQLGNGNYLRGAPIWTFDIENETYNIPFALGIGKVVKVNHTVFNLFVEPQYAMLYQGTQPQISIFTGINLQFLSQHK